MLRPWLLAELEVVLEAEWVVVHLVALQGLVVDLD